ncbi:hypothetical protein [Clostridium cylindrosporum]|uniref:Uncharacterized protein n=1 Tax=Clostridium cylindrosporum DSM 605 TaxID=1121307 RepID=A0A0J8D8V0_CLOCY|nr:hypothetical protein [Clostridium cylindrosporum]KMT22302.1 hypothetical protein CLCY_4c02750 [Clostridium cylindrosporum DSM 605]
MPNSKETLPARRFARILIAALLVFVNLSTITGKSLMEIFNSIFR